MIVLAEDDRLWPVHRRSQAFVAARAEIEAGARCSCFVPLAQDGQGFHVCFRTFRSSDLKA